MFTLFDLIRVLAIAGVAVSLGAIGWNTFGTLGCVLGVAFGFVLGGIIGQLPLLVGLKWISLRFDRMTDEQLVDELHDPACLTPNILLLELNRRGYDIHRELPFVQSFLASDQMHRRTAGWAALTSALPQLAGRISGYNPTAPVADCRWKCRALLDGTAQCGESEPPKTRDFTS